jgi:hypothetical protein
MENRSYSTSFTVDQSSSQVFDAINNVGGWWSGQIEGETGRLGAAFTYRYKDMHRSKQAIVEFVPGKRVAWHVVDSNLSFLKDKSEWNGTDIIFDITEQAGKTELRFTHAGLAPEIECYDSCSNAWGMLVNGNLRNLITTGRDQPDVFG